MRPDPTAASSSSEPEAGEDGRARPRRRWLAVVTVGLVVQVIVALAAFTAERPARYAWQMYSAVPYTPPAWTVHGDEERELAVNELFVHGRAEIDRVALLRERGCDLVEADAIRFEHPDGRSETVACS